MPQSFTVPQLVAHFTGLFQDAPDPGHNVILAALTALPEGEYATVDTEDEFPAWIYALGGPEIALHPGYTMMSGDLSIRRLATRCGTGLLISWATELYILPVGLLGFMAEEND